jgi:hypothetical protein
VPEPPEPQAAEPSIDLKDPIVAGVLAWLVPGLGHFYQGRYAKAVLYFVCIQGTFVYGLYLGSSSTVGWGRDVYLSFRWNDLRLPYLCQIGVGLPTVPVSLIQADRFHSGKEPLWHGFMAPPKITAGEPGGVTAQDLYRKLPRVFEMGTVYTMIAGLLNILAIYDACCGPVPLEPNGKDGQPEDEEEPPPESDAAEKPS